MTAPQPQPKPPRCPLCKQPVYVDDEYPEDGHSGLVECDTPGCPLYETDMPEDTMRRLLLAPEGVREPVVVERDDLIDGLIVLSAHGATETHGKLSRWVPAPPPPGDGR